MVELPSQAILLVLGALAAVIVVPVTIRTVLRLRVLRRRKRRMQEGDGPRCSHCGYNLTGVEIPRCPECGRAVGFDRTLAELGVSEEEAIAFQRRRRAELARYKQDEDEAPSGD